ncbi:MAG: prepilin-type N-terminal cleavage/methylation domain-containing protein, partial [Alicyclobacillaceae bacterium]|nr:prepilin-type N-terminal cleavage/methylation domain-containing protein [Alicyclobacillaceae bacterium]
MRKYLVPQSQLNPQVEEEVTQQAARRKRQRGFTLIEMLAVVLILAIVAGVGFVVVNNQIEDSKVKTDMANLRTIADATNRYIMDNGGSLPSSVSALVGKYLGSEPKDPWEQKSYIIKDNGNNTLTISSPHTPKGQSGPQSLTINY